MLASPMELKPCRDCGTFVPWTSRSCPHCGILNPVAKWVALPEGADETYREPAARRAETPAPGYPAAYASAPAAPAPRASTGYAQIYGQMAPPAARPPALGRTETPAGGPDPLAAAHKNIRQCAGVFYVVAALNLLASFLLGPIGLVAAAVLAGLATWLRTQQSQVAAAMLLLFSLLNLVLVIKSAQMYAAWPAFIMVLAAVRGLNGTMALKGARLSVA